MSDSMESYFKCHAQIRLDSLHFEGGRATNEKNIKRLLHIFRTEGCHQYDSKYSIPVVMNAELLASALHMEDLNSPVLYNSATSSPRLDLSSGVKITGLHGKHRVQAGMKYLKPLNQWWNVRIYDEDLPLHIRTSMQEEFAKSLEFSDGDIFRYLVNAEISGDETAVKRWSARLSKWDKKNFDRLVLYDGGKLFSAFEKLLPFDVLWSAFDFGALDRIFSMHCYEEVYCYLEKVRQTWADVLRADMALESLDLQMMEFLELKMPAHSRHDANIIHTQMHNRKLFPTLLDNSARQEVENRLLKCRRILTMNTFFQDTIYLRVCFEGLRCLIPDQPFTQSLRKTFHNYINHEQDFLTSYIRLCVCSLRNFLYLSDGKFSNLRQQGRQRKKKQQVSNIKLGQIAGLAASLGFQTDEIDGKMAHNDEHCLPERPSRDVPALGDDLLNLPKDARANRPYEDMYHWYRDHLFLEKILQPIDEPLKTYPTPFAVGRDIVLSFWEVSPGDTSIHIAQADEGAQSSQVANTMISFQGLLDSLESSARASSSIYSPPARTRASSPVSRGEVCSITNIIDSYGHPFHDENDARQHPVAQVENQNLLGNHTLPQAPLVTPYALAEHEAHLTMSPTLETSEQQEQQRSETTAMVIDGARDTLTDNPLSMSSRHKRKDRPRTIFPGASAEGSVARTAELSIPATVEESGGIQHQGEDDLDMSQEQAVSMSRNKTLREVQGNFNGLDTARDVTNSSTPGILAGDHRTIFPGSLFGSSGSVQSRPIYPPLLQSARGTAMKRKIQGDDVGVQKMLRTEQQSIQMPRRDPFHDQVALVKSLWDRLDHSVVYVTSTVDIDELTPRLQLHHSRLWRWAEDEEVDFESCLSPLLRAGYHLHLVSSEHHPEPPHYLKAGVLDAWAALRRSSTPLYWLAILSTG